MIKRLMSFMVLLAMVCSVLTLTSCREFNIERQFDLSDEKEYCDATIDDIFGGTAIYVELKKTSTYPELKLKDFKLDNAESIEYLAIKPDSDSELASEIFRQQLIIRLKKTGKEEVLKAIRQLEKLKFIRYAGASARLDRTEDLGQVEGLDPQIELGIIKTFYGTNYIEGNSKSPIALYYGTYNNSVVFYCVQYSFWKWARNGLHFGNIVEAIIEDIVFIFPVNVIKVWNNNVLYGLQEAYDKVFLTKENLEQIAARTKEQYPNFYEES